jgi:hypothetical protein
MLIFCAQKVFLKYCKSIIKTDKNEIYHFRYNIFEEPSGN